MTDHERFEIYGKAVRRAKDNGVDMLSYTDIIVFLEKEIDRYRNKIGYLENHIKELKTRLNSAYGTSQLEAVQENTVTEIIKALADNGYNTITINCYKDIESEE